MNQNLGKMLLVALLFCCGFHLPAVAEPQVANVRASQREGTKLVEIVYDLTVTDPSIATVEVTIRISSDAGTTWDVPCHTLSGNGIGRSVVPGTDKQIVWDARADWDQQWSDQMLVEVTATDLGSAGGNYLVIDVSAGPDAQSYPTSSLAAVPDGGWTDVHKTTKIVLRRIPAGTFTMGSPDDELGRLNNETQRTVTLSRDLYIGVFAVTQKQWERVMGNWPSHFSNTAYRDSRPVELVSWDVVRGGTWPGDPAGTGQPAADTFMQKLRDRTGFNFDLPTEAQWEYACRAGTTTALNSGKNLTATDTCPNMAEVGRYASNHPGGYSTSSNVSTDGGTAKVGSYLPNVWGLYDTHGNVFEWCLDWHGSYPSGALTDPVGQNSESLRVYRGGSWDITARYCRSAFRSRGAPGNAYGYLGFRVALAPAVQ